MTFNLIAFSKMTFSIMTLSIALNKLRQSAKLNSA
jgi:hypothetical protein